MTNLHEAMRRESITARMDRLPLTAMHIAFVVVIGFGLLFDMMETTMSTVLSTVFSAPGSGVSRNDLMLLLLGFFMGGAIGAPILGRLSDRIGRKKTLAIIFAGFGILTIATALTTSFQGLAIMRAASGFVLAAGPPMVWVTLADVLPSAKRGTIMMATAAFGALGASLSNFITHVAGKTEPFGLDGWRFTLIIGGIAGIILSFILQLLPESPRWLAAKGRFDEAEAALARFSVGQRNVDPPPPAAPTANPVRDGAPPATPSVKAAIGLFSSAYRGRFILLLALQFLQTLGIAGIAVLSGAVLVHKGYNVEDSILIVGLTALGAPVGALLAATVIDRIERRTLFVILSFCIAASGLIFALAASAPVAIVAGTLIHILSAIYSAVLHIYGAEIFPTAVRGSAAGGAYAANRVGGALVPLALLPLLVASGPAAMFAVVAIVLGGAAIIALIFGPTGTVGKPLD